MRVALTPDQEKLREELRGYFAELVTPERRAALAAASGEFGEARVYREVIRQLGEDGWLGIGWPEEYGGQARSMVDQLIFTDVAAVAGVPIPYLTLNTVGPTIMRYGTDAQKEYFLPRILRGELHFSIGYSEPGSGTDLASLRTRAVLEGSLASSASRSRSSRSPRRRRSRPPSRGPAGSVSSAACASMTARSSTGPSTGSTSTPMASRTASTS